MASDRDTCHQLEALVECHGDLGLVERRIWEAWDRDEIGSPVCLTLLGKLRERRKTEAEERRK